jgi:hypothetical protein
MTMMLRSGSTLSLALLHNSQASRMPPQSPLMTLLWLAGFATVLFVMLMGSESRHLQC